MREEGEEGGTSGEGMKGSRDQRECGWGLPVYLFSSSSWRRMPNFSNIIQRIWWASASAYVESERVAFSIRDPKRKCTLLFWIPLNHPIFSSLLIIVFSPSVYVMFRLSRAVACRPGDQALVVGIGGPRDIDLPVDWSLIASHCRRVGACLAIQSVLMGVH